MRRREFVALLGATAIGWPLALRAHPALAGPLPILSELPKAMRCQIVGRQWGRRVATHAKLLIAPVTFRQRASQIELVSSTRRH